MLSPSKEESKETSLQDFVPIPRKKIRLSSSEFENSSNLENKQFGEVLSHHLSKDNPLFENMTEPSNIGFKSNFEPIKSRSASPGEMVIVESGPTNDQTLTLSTKFGDKKLSDKTNSGSASSNSINLSKTSYQISPPVDFTIKDGNINQDSTKNDYVDDVTFSKNISEIQKRGKYQCIYLIIYNDC